MRIKSVPTPKPEDKAAERLIFAVESAIDVIQERLANLTNDTQDAKWSVSDLVRLLQLRTQLQAERPRNISVRWVDDTIGPKSKEYHNE
jgi:hypothetical protein